MPRKNYQKKPAPHNRFKPSGDCSDKALYKTKQEAEAVIADLQIMHPGLQLRAYRSPKCGGWHLTRKIL